MRTLAAAGALFATMFIRAVATQQASPEPFPGLLDDHPAIAYATRQTTDRVARLNAALEAGQARLSFQEAGGYVRSVLDALGVSPSSQLLVFSKTGIQGGFTSPATPRALYFDDSLVVGYIPGARVIELAVHDPDQGVVFYTIDQTESPAPRFARRTVCVSCHVSENTLDVPGILARSNVAGADGNILPQLGNHVVDHRTPVAQRWGGWFVTGTYDAPAYIGVAHMGNVTVAVHPTSGPATTSNEVFVQWLASAPQARGYASHESDIANLMLFDHQARAINLLTRLNWEARVAASAGRTSLDGPLTALVDELVDYFLFVDEASPPGRVLPPAALLSRMAAAGPRDRQGRSLRDLDFSRRLLRYPCSYMIYSPAFEHLPAFVKRAVHDQLGTVLSGAQRAKKYAHLSAADRSAIVDILRDTKAGLSASFGR